MIRQKKTTIKAPWDPEVFEVVKIKESKVKLKQGEEVRNRAKNHIKVVEERPKELLIGKKVTSKPDPKLDLEVSWMNIQTMGAQQNIPRPQEEEALPDLPDSEIEQEREEAGGGGQGQDAQEDVEEEAQEDKEQEQEEKGGSCGRVADQEGARLLDTLHCQES